MNNPTPTLEQSAAAQIGETITCWLAKKLDENESWQESDDANRKFAGSVGIKIAQLDNGRLVVNLKTRVNVAPDTDEMEIVVDDPRQAKLPLNQED